MENCGTPKHAQSLFLSPYSSLVHHCNEAIKTLDYQRYVKITFLDSLIEIPNAKPIPYQMGYLRLLFKCLLIFLNKKTCSNLFTGYFCAAFKSKK